MSQQEAEVVAADVVVSEDAEAAGLEPEVAEVDEAFTTGLTRLTVIGPAPVTGLLFFETITCSTDAPAAPTDSRVPNRVVSRPTIR